MLSFRPLRTFCSVHASPLWDWKVHNWQSHAGFCHWSAAVPAVVEAAGISRYLPVSLFTAVNPLSASAGASQKWTLTSAGGG